LVYYLFCKGCKNNLFCVPKKSEFQKGSGVENNAGTVAETGFTTTLCNDIGYITDLILVWLPAAFFEN
jgi:hypothetical protein